MYISSRDSAILFFWFYRLPYARRLGQERKRE